MQQLRNRTRFLGWTAVPRDNAPRALLGRGFGRTWKLASRREKMQAGQIVALEQEGLLYAARTTPSRTATQWQPAAPSTNPCQMALW